MKPILLAFTFFTVAGISMVKYPGNNRAPGAESNSITMCGPVPTGNETLDENGKNVIALPGWGSYSYPITTKMDSAQFYFDQGLNMYYSYHMKEAAASFKEASRLDPSSPMTYWGQALAMGPYYNFAHSYFVPEGIKDVLLGMNRNMGNASEKEMHLIKAMNSRYPAEFSGSKTKALDMAYATEIRKLITLYPDDADIKTLYIDAVMLMHAWDFWSADGTAKTWTPEVVDLCAKVLKDHPQHPAALHYYIHLTEASRHPEVALANADALKNLLPGVAHMVHMASHEYQRNGLYAKGVEVNDMADDNLVNYEAMAKNLILNKHSPHYFAVQTYCALTGGMYQRGLQNALRCRGSVSPTKESTYDQYLYMMPVLTMVRLGKWDEILKDNVVPDAKWSYAQLIHHFAKGLAFVNKSERDSARWHLAQLREYQKDPILEKRRVPFNAPVQMAAIAEHILDASVDFSMKNNRAAIRKLTQAIVVEDQLIYTEPGDWPVPTRQFLGAFLLKMKKPALAEKVYREDLTMSPNNGWSLLGLYQSLDAQKKTEELTTYKTKYLESFSSADEIPTGSVYLK